MSFALPGATGSHNHGTRGCYVKGCRCSECRDANYLPLVDIMDGGLESHDDYTLDQVVKEFQRRVIIATIEASPSMAEAARTLGITREGLYGLRKRHGLPVVPQVKPIPDDWRERLGT